MEELTKLVQETAMEYDIRNFFKELYLSAIKAFKSLKDHEKEILLNGKHETTTMLYFFSNADGFISIINDYDEIETEIIFDTKEFMIGISLRPTTKPIIIFEGSDLTSESPDYHFHEILTDDPDILDNIFGEYLESTNCWQSEEVCHATFSVYEKWFLN